MGSGIEQTMPSNDGIAAVKFESRASLFLMSSLGSSYIGSKIISSESRR